MGKAPRYTTPCHGRRASGHTDRLDDVGARATAAETIRRRGVNESRALDGLPEINARQLEKHLYASDSGRQPGGGAQVRRGRAHIDVGVPTRSSKSATRCSPNSGRRSPTGANESWPCIKAGAGRRRLRNGGRKRQSVGRRSEKGARDPMTACHSVNQRACSVPLAIAPSTR